MYFWLNYCDENHVEKIPIAVKNINHLFHLASEIIEAGGLHLLLLSDGTRIDDDEYLESLEQIQKLSIYFESNRYLSLKNISYSLNNDFFMKLGCFYANKPGGCFSEKNNLEDQLLSSFIEAVLSSTFYQVLFKVFFIVFTYDFEQPKRVRNE